MIESSSTKTPWPTKRQKSIPIQCTLGAVPLAKRVVRKAVKAVGCASVVSSISGYLARSDASCFFMRSMAGSVEVKKRTLTLPATFCGVVV